MRFQNCRFVLFRSVGVIIFFLTSVLFWNNLLVENVGAAVSTININDTAGSCTIEGKSGKYSLVWQQRPGDEASLNVVGQYPEIILSNYLPEAPHYKIDAITLNAHDHGASWRVQIAGWDPVNNLWRVPRRKSDSVAHIDVDTINGSSGCSDNGSGNNDSNAQCSTHHLNTGTELTNCYAANTFDLVNNYNGWSNSISKLVIEPVCPPGAAECADYGSHMHVKSVTLTFTPNPFPPTPTVTPTIRGDLTFLSGNGVVDKGTATCGSYTCRIFDVYKSNGNNKLPSLVGKGYKNGVVDESLVLSLHRSQVSSECWYGAESGCLTESVLLNQRQYGSEVNAEFDSQNLTVGSSYYVVINAVDRSTSPASACSGNPFVTYPYAGFQNCSGSSPTAIGRIRVNVINRPAGVDVLYCNGTKGVSDAPTNLGCANGSYLCPSKTGVNKLECVTTSNPASNCSYCGPLPTQPVPTNTPRPTPTGVSPTPPPDPLKTYSVRAFVNCGDPSRVAYTQLIAKVVTDNNGTAAGGVIKTNDNITGISQCRPTALNPGGWKVDINSREIGESIEVSMMAVNNDPGKTKIADLELSEIDGVAQSTPLKTSFVWVRGGSGDFSTEKRLTFKVPAGSVNQICGPLITPEPNVQCTGVVPTLPPGPTVVPSSTPTPTPTRVPTSTPTPTPVPVLEFVHACKAGAQREVQFRLRNATAAQRTTPPALTYVIRSGYWDHNSSEYSITVNSGTVSGNDIIYTDSLDKYTNTLLSGEGLSNAACLFEERTDANSGRGIAIIRAYTAGRSAFRWVPTSLVSPPMCGTFSLVFASGGNPWPPSPIFKCEFYD